MIRCPDTRAAKTVRTVLIVQLLLYVAMCGHKLQRLANDSGRSKMPNVCGKGYDFGKTHAFWHQEARKQLRNRAVVSQCRGRGFDSLPLQ